MNSILIHLRIRHFENKWKHNKLKNILYLYEIQNDAARVILFFLFVCSFILH